MTRFADFTDNWSDPSDAPEDDAWGPLDELEHAIAALAEKLRYEPGLSRAGAQLFVKSETNVPGIFFRTLIWPQARLLAGLPASAGKGGRPRKKPGVETGRSVS
jgi:hypothetical protein